MKREKIGLYILLLSVILFTGIPLGLHVIRTRAQVIDLHARMPENGGWSTDTMKIRAGEPLHLRLTSDDVVHGFAVGKTDLVPVEIIPGEFVETTITFDKPGRYTFYCNRWCGVNHWRMHGIIEVEGPEAEDTAEPPLYIQLGIDIDAPHMAKVIPDQPTSAEHGEGFASLLPDYATDRDTYLSTSPSDLWIRLRAEPGLNQLTDEDVWDAVRWLWERQSDADSLGIGLRLFLDMAAAAHGELGKGDGVMVRGLPTMDHEHMESQKVKPPDFTDPYVLLGASPALLEGKILRGGMGTGMPSFGAILTDEQVDAVVDYLYTIAWNAVDHQVPGVQETPHPSGN